MKPAELQPLLGRWVELYCEGLRTGKVVRIVGTDRVTVQLLDPYGSRIVNISTIRYVLLKRKVWVTLTEFLTPCPTPPVDPPPSKPSEPALPPRTPSKRRLGPKNSPRRS